MTHIERANALVHGNHLAQLSETEHKVWQVFHVHANGITGLAFPGTTKVAKLIGHKDHKRARQAIDALVVKGFLKLVTPATFTVAATYLVTVPTQSMGLATSAGRNGEEGGQLLPPGHLAPEVEQTSPGHDHPPTGGQIGPSPGGQIGPPNSEWNSETNSGGGSRVTSSAEKQTGAQASVEVPPGFVRWWAAYPDHPRRIGRRQALAVWVAEGLESAADAIVAHTEASARSPAWTESDRRWMPAPTRYLEERRFEAKTPTPPATRRSVSEHELAAIRAAPVSLDRDMALGSLSRGEFDQLAAETIAAAPVIAREALGMIEPRRNEALKWKMFELLTSRNSAPREDECSTAATAGSRLRRGYRRRVSPDTYRRA